MSPQLSLALQYVVIAIAVLISGWVVFRKQAPDAARRMRIALALPMVREGRPLWLRAIGRRMAPTPKTGTDGCAGCGSCDTGRTP